MNFFESVLDLVGNTPLVRLNNIVEPDMATVFAKISVLFLFIIFCKKLNFLVAKIPNTIIPIGITAINTKKLTQNVDDILSV